MRCRLRSSLTHLGVRSLRCSPPPSPGTIRAPASRDHDRPRGRKAELRPSHGWTGTSPAVPSNPDKPRVRGACEHLGLALLPPVVLSAGGGQPSWWSHDGCAGSVRVSSPLVPSGSSHPRRSARGSGRGCRTPAQGPRRTWSLPRATASLRPSPNYAAAPWYRLDPVLDRDGALAGQRLTIGLDGERTARTLDLAREAFAAGPFGAVVLVGSDDGTTSRVQAVDVASGCAWPIVDERDVIRRATSIRPARSSTRCASIARPVPTSGSGDAASTAARPHARSSMRLRPTTGSAAPSRPTSPGMPRATGSPSSPAASSRAGSVSSRRAAVRP